jgi:fatty acid desaturase
MSALVRSHSHLLDQPNQGAPESALLTHVKSTNRAGAGYFLLTSAVTAAGIVLASSSRVVPWLAGQILVATAFTQWFCLLHECGHDTLFRSRRLNRLAGHIAGFFALIPFGCWRRVHALHHRWTGWQDLDPTTEGLTRKPSNRALMQLANFCWRWWLPLFSVVYRLTNYWHVSRLRRVLHGGSEWRALAVNAALCAMAYAVLLAWLRPMRLLRLTGPGLLAGLIFQDVFLLSQHTHLPQCRSERGCARPFAPRDQEVFTRSLRFPAWFSRLVLLHSDAHELHHMYPNLPGYRLHDVPYRTRNEMPWWRWTLAARRIPAEQFLYQNRNQTGYDL